MTHHSFTDRGATRPARLAAPLLVAAMALILALSFSGMSDVTRTAASGMDIDAIAARLIDQPRPFPEGS